MRLNILRFLKLSITAAACLAPGLLPAVPSSYSAAAVAGHLALVTVSYTPGKPLSRFSPFHAFGAGVDGHSKGDTAQIFTPANVRAMLSAGLKPLTFRLRTELGVDDWHWNPAGRWSNPASHSGYWTSSSRTQREIRTCFGYRLPRRGDTIDQADNSGYSRLDDGDTSTFWKSNPYLDRRFTGDAASAHSQWVVIDLGSHRPVNAMKIDWADPFARQLTAEYWQGTDDTGPNPLGKWLTFAGGRLLNGHGGGMTLVLSPTPVLVRFVRLTMTDSSGTGPPGSIDIRDRLGFAIREIGLGTIDKDHHFHDEILHGRSRHTQTLITVSSTDPWHTAGDRDDTIEQPGFDLVYHLGLTNHLPALVPVGVLYSTPANAAAEISYLKRRGFPIAGVELGEEPDGQYVPAEDYAALYVQFARAIHAVDPGVRLGGPSFQDPEIDVQGWPEKPRQSTWLSRVLGYLRTHGRARDFNFCTLEWYPFDNICQESAPQLERLPEMTAAMVERLRSSGLPPGTPLIITEYGYSAFAGQSEVDMAGALLNAEVAAQFLTLGGSAAYLYGYEPTTLDHNESCESWGNNAILLTDSDYHIRCRTATYFTARMLAREWALPVDRPHELYGASVSEQGAVINDESKKSENAGDPPPVTAYATRRPDGKWSILLLNKDPDHTWSVRIGFLKDGAPFLPFQHGADLVQLSAATYCWHPKGPHGFPSPDDAPARSVIPGPDPAIILPPYSVSVVRTRGFQGPDRDGRVSAFQHSRSAKKYTASD